MVESFKSGFEPPSDVEFEDYGQAMKRTVSENSLSNSKESKEKPAGKSKPKLWPFIKNKNKVTHRAALKSLTRFDALFSPGGQPALFGAYCGTKSWRQLRFFLSLPEN